MFRSILAFELKSYATRWSTYIYFAAFFGLAFLIGSVAGGAIDGSNISLGVSNQVYVNSPFSLNLWFSIFSYIGMLVAAPMFGQAVYKDFHHHIHGLFFSKPISKTSYLAGRFVAALIITAIIFSSFGVGYWLSSLMPFVEAKYFGPNHLSYYVTPYLTIVLPNLLCFGGIFFALACMTRKIFPVYLGSILLFVGYLIGSELTADIDNSLIASLLDPFGVEAVSRMTKYWTASEQNQHLITLTSWLLFNRLLWCGIGLACLAFTIVRFRFSEALPGTSRKRLTQPNTEFTADTVRQAVSQSFNRSQLWQLFVQQTRLEFMQIIKNVFFLIIVLCGLLYLLVIGSQFGEFYGTPIYPVTYRMHGLMSQNFVIFMLIVITIYAGELVWRERDAGMHQMTAALPVPNAVFSMSKLMALIGVVAALLLMVMMCCMLLQAFRGYYQFEVGLYLQLFFISNFPRYILLCMLAFFVHVLVNNKFLGHFAVIFCYLTTLFMPWFGIEHRLFRFAAAPGIIYSDMNGFGHFLKPYLWFMLYWFFFGCLLTLVVNLLWVRGDERGIPVREKLAKKRWNNNYRSLFIGLCGCFLLTGAWIYYNTNVLNTYVGTKAFQEAQADFEKQYKHFKDEPQPRITKVFTEVDIYPERREARAKGTYTMVNKHSQPVTRLIVNVPGYVVVDKIAASLPMETEIDDRERGFSVFSLGQPLQPGETLEMNFEVSFLSPGFKSGSTVNQFVHNGTFFNNRQLMPSLGYNEAVQISDNRLREEYDLDPEPRMPPIQDEEALKNTYIASDSDWIEFETIVSTSADQTAIAPGYLQREWSKPGRRYFHYKMDSKILHFYAYISAKFEVTKGIWRDVPIEIYHHPKHDYNVGRMIAAIQDSLEFFTTHFSPYQHRQVRIIEFPRFASFAQSFPNTIPYSESIGFISDVGDLVDPQAPDFTEKLTGLDDDRIDYPYYITSHEIAHQWFAHQVIGGNVQGSTMLSETFSQYGALMVMEKRFGAENMRRFLKYELDQYLTGRRFEDRGELPLYLNEGQGYIHYNKGSLVMYALKDYFGAPLINRVIARFIQDKAFQEAPFTTSVEFLDYLRAEVPEEQHDLITDLFEKIILFENRALDASAVPLEDDRYRVTISVNAQKFEAAEDGAELEISFSQPLDIGVFDEKKQPLYLGKHDIKDGEQTVTVEVTGKPHRAGIDPFNKMIDRRPDDNTVKVTLDDGSATAPKLDQNSAPVQDEPVSDTADTADTATPETP